MAKNPSAMFGARTGSVGQPSADGERRHFAALDGLRGIAAFAVVLYHVCLPLHIVVAPKAYLAVDFFFLLSGFVIGNAYEERLRAGGSFIGFAKRRLIRLYPLFLLGMTMGIVVSGLKLLLSGADMGLLHFMGVAAFGLLLMPFGRLPYSEQHFAFPFNGPAWSLFFEFAINFLYALVAPLLSDRVLSLLLLVSAVAFASLIGRHGSADMGGTLATFPGGFVRVSFSFLAGIALFRRTESGGLPSVRFGALAGALLLVLVLLFPAPGLLGWWYDSAAVLLAFPLVLVLSLEEGSSPALRRVALFAGALSYPLYITHYPIMRVFQFIAEKKALGGGELGMMVVLEVMSMLAFSYVALEYVDEHVRSYLTSRSRA